MGSIFLVPEDDTDYENENESQISKDTHLYGPTNALKIWIGSSEIYQTIFIFTIIELNFAFSYRQKHQND